MPIRVPRFKSALAYFAKKFGVARAPVIKYLTYETAKAPFFDGEISSAWFLERLKASRFYLEFGSGGTTYAAAKTGVPFASKESDFLFSLSVQETLRRDGLLSQYQTHVYADIGLTENWGYPAFPNWVSPKRKRLFEAYSDLPDMPTLPDLILIDGRFRVATALKCIKALSGTEDWTIVVDDYVDRTHYHLIENYAQLDEMVGRMAVFTRKAEVDWEALDRSIKHHLHDYR